MQDPLFFIAVLPDAEIQDEVTAFKQECTRLYQASHALKSPPHITLISPFRWPLDQLEEMRIALTDFAHDQLSFSIRLNGFAGFPPRVLYVDVEKNESLREIQSDLEQFLARQTGLKVQKGHGFNPHMTIAHRDLQQSVYPRAYSYFSKKDYQQQFLVNDLVMLRHLNGRWEIAERFGFG